MAQKKSIVKEIIENYRKPYTAQGSLNYVHSIEFENGDKGDYSSKTEKCLKFTKGQESSYTIEENGGFAPKIKPIQDTPSYSGNNKEKMTPETQAAIRRQCALKCACNLYQQSSNINDTKNILETATEFNKWLSE